MDAILVGTVLHYDSVLARFLKNPLWNRKVFKAILHWPERMDLWEQFEGLLLNAETPQKGESAAMALYQEHQADMERGAQVSWPIPPSTASNKTTQWRARMRPSPTPSASG